MKKNNRKVYLINPRFQLQFIAWMGGIGFSVLGVFAIAHMIFFKNLRALAGEAGLPSDHVFFQFIQERQAELNELTIITSIFVVFVVVIAGLLLSNKIAGPLFRFREHLKRSTEEKSLSAVTFRKGDYFTELADEYNKHIQIVKND